jgi:hypothetical protein
LTFPIKKWAAAVMTAVVLIAVMVDRRAGGLSGRSSPRRRRMGRLTAIGKPFGSGKAAEFHNSTRTFQ